MFIISFPAYFTNLKRIGNSFTKHYISNKSTGAITPFLTLDFMIQEVMDF